MIGTTSPWLYQHLHLTTIPAFFILLCRPRRTTSPPTEISPYRHLPHTRNFDTDRNIIFRHLLVPLPMKISRCQYLPRLSLPKEKSSYRNRHALMFPSAMSFHRFRCLTCYRPTLQAHPEIRFSPPQSNITEGGARKKDKVRL